MCVLLGFSLNFWSIPITSVVYDILLFSLVSQTHFLCEQWKKESGNIVSIDLCSYT